MTHGAQQKRQELQQTFATAYEELNTAQQQAVDTIDGPVMVIAGPGTGKTQILTLRIANILLKTDAKPEEILALTFTDSGAKAMRERLQRYIGAEAYQVAIHTFHGFAEQLIRNNPDAYTRVVGGRPATDIEKIDIVQSIIDGGEIRKLRPMGDPAYYVQPIIRTIGSLKKEYITPDGLAEIIQRQEVELQGIEKVHQKGAHKGKVRGEYTKKETAIEKNRELLYVYRCYEASLEERRLYDVEDMIVETVETLSQNEDLLRDLQETYQYVLADEHQDVNGSQNRILELLCNYHDRPNIFVVGDEKQAIYRFQGASLENFLYFGEVFGELSTIALTDNYRSGQVILDTAHSLVAVEDGPLRELRVPLTAQAVEDSSVFLRDFSHQAVEDASVVQQIRSCIEKGIPPQEIAVIVRTNKEVEQFASLLRAEDIPVSATADGDILDHPITHTIMNLVDAVVAPHDQETLFTLMHGPYWKIGVNDLVRIAKARSYDTPLHAIISSRERLTDIQVEHIDAVLNVSRVLALARENETVEAPHRVLQMMLQESGLLDHTLSSGAVEASRVIRRLYDEIEEMVLQNSTATLREVSAVLAVRKKHRLPLSAPYIHTQRDAVQVMTAHKSKGLEFEVVFIPHVCDSVCGGTTKRTYFDIPQTTHIKEEVVDVIDDERRLLYVAMTRAKHTLHLSYAETNAEGKELLCSRLLSDIDPTYITNIDVRNEEDTFDPLAVLRTSQKQIAIDSALLKRHLEEKGLSATSLNNYLRSPWDYLYRNVLKIPEVQAEQLQFGTAIHGVMEWVSAFNTETGTMPSDTQVKEALERQLSRLPIGTAEYVRLHEKGLTALYAYLTHAKSSLTPHAHTEFSVSVSLPTGLPSFPLLPLTGKLDRLDLDAEGNVTLIVDYKTGKPKTRNDIEGNTKSSNGDYKRQLTFYVLLLSLYEDTRFACRTCKLSFIEPDAKGVVHEEIFEITDQEVEELKKELIRIAEEISTGSFLNIPCDPSTSSYCHLVASLTDL